MVEGMEGRRPFESPFIGFYHRTHRRSERYVSLDSKTVEWYMTRYKLEANEG